MGVELEVSNFVGEGQIERDLFINSMKEYEAKILDGQGSVPQSVPGVSQYANWKWGTGQDLLRTARAGGLCDQIFLKSQNLSW